MRWLWQTAERLETSGGYTEIISRLMEVQAARTTQQATAAMEAATGLLSRAFASATVDAPDDIAEALAPRCLAQIGRDLVRVGESFQVIRMTGGGLGLVPDSTWYWERDADPESWLWTRPRCGSSIPRVAVGPPFGGGGNSDGLPGRSRTRFERSTRTGTDAGRSYPAGGAEQSGLYREPSRSDRPAARPHCCVHLF